MGGRDVRARPCELHGMHDCAAALVRVWTAGPRANEAGCEHTRSSIPCALSVGGRARPAETTPPHGCARVFKMELLIYCFPSNIVLYQFQGPSIAVRPWCALHSDSPDISGTHLARITWFMLRGLLCLALPGDRLPGES